MGEAVAELFATKIFWELWRYSQEALVYTRQRTFYDEEVVILKKIAIVLGISEDLILSWRSENNYGRKQLQMLFKKLTRNNNFWDELEYKIDYVVRAKVLRVAQPQFKIDQKSIENVRQYRKEINNMLKGCFNKERQMAYYQILGYNILT